MKMRARIGIGEGAFIFLLLAGVLASLVMTLFMPSAATQATWLGWAVCATIVVSLGLANVVAWSANREKRLSKVGFPFGVAGLFLLALTGVFYLFGI